MEIDAAFALTLGLSDGQEVTVALHLESPLVDTVNIEPLTPEDWEIIELHASFLEFSLIRKVRALPDSGYNSSGGSGHSDHPITLHLTPTTTANIKLVSPHPDPNSPFVKLGPNAESLLHQNRERDLLVATHEQAAMAGPVKPPKSTYFSEELIEHVAQICLIANKMRMKT